MKIDEKRLFYTHIENLKMNIFCMFVSCGDKLCIIKDVTILQKLNIRYQALSIDNNFNPLFNDNV